MEYTARMAPRSWLITGAGEDAVSAIRAKITAVSDDLARTAALSRSTNFAVAGPR